jgi:hypothetical protein
VKKLISIGIALALLVTFTVPVAVAAQDIVDPGTYSKTPFGILGSGIQLVGGIINDLADMIDTFGLPIDAVDLASVVNTVGGWTGTDLAWMTDMTAWSMVLVGNVVKAADPLIPADMDLPFELGALSDLFYVVGARLWDPWDTYAGDSTLPDVIIDNFPPGIDLPFPVV